MNEAPKSYRGWEINPLEFAYYAREEGPANAMEFDLYIPKITPNAEFALNNEWKQSIDSSVCINDPECKITFEKNVKVTNTVRVPRYISTRFASHYFKQKAQFYVEFPTLNIDTVFLTDRIDQSYPKSIKSK